MTFQRLIVCADDFGMSQDIDDGVIALAQSHRLTAVSCMAHAPWFERDAARLQGLDVDVGLHLTFTERLGARRFYLSLPRLTAYAYARLLDTAQLTRQIERQLDRFEHTIGRAPDFVDGHQHVHQLPQIREALLAVLARRYGNDGLWVRCGKPGTQTGLPYSCRNKAAMIGVLGAAAFTRLAAAAGLPSNRRLLGVYDFRGGVQRYTDLLDHWLRNARDGDLLMCHPALAGTGCDDHAGQRAAEYHALASPGFARALQRHGLQLARQGGGKGGKPFGASAACMPRRHLPHA